MASRLEVIAGSMYSGKSEELLRRIRRAKIAQKTVHVYKHSVDDRYHEAQVVSHDGNRNEGIPVSDLSILAVLPTTVDIVAIDEVQFFDPSAVDILQGVVDTGITVVVAGLDTDFRGNPFPTMANLMAVADIVTKLHAVCIPCGGEASRTFLKQEPEDESNVLIGGSDLYEARCRHCFRKPIDFDARL